MASPARGWPRQTTLEVRQNILRSFTQVDGNVRLVFATVAFAMGLDAPDVRQIIHWSPSRK